jgi:hypothetical protein
MTHYAARIVAHVDWKYREAGLRKPTRVDLSQPVCSLERQILYFVLEQQVVSRAQLLRRFISAAGRVVSQELFQRLLNHRWLEIMETQDFVKEIFFTLTERGLATVDDGVVGRVYDICPDLFFVEQKATRQDVFRQYHLTEIRLAMEAKSQAEWFSPLRLVADWLLQGRWADRPMRSHGRHPARFWIPDALMMPIGIGAPSNLVLLCEPPALSRSRIKSLLREWESFWHQDTKVILVPNHERLKIVSDWITQELIIFYQTELERERVSLETLLGAYAVSTYKEFVFAQATRKKSDERDR